MKIEPKAAFRRGPALALGLACGLLSSCGVVYTPQEFEQSAFQYGYKGDFGDMVEVVSMDFVSARIANRTSYKPRILPDVFTQTDPLDTISTRERIAAAGLDRVDPAQMIELPAALAPYDGAREVLAPALREEGRAPVLGPEPPARAFQPASFATLDAGGGMDGYRAVGAGVGVGSGLGEGAGPAFPAAAPSDFASDSDLSVRLERPRLRREVTGNVVPDVDPGPYRIGPGDVIGLQVRSQAGSLLGSEEDAAGAPQVSQRLLVQDNGEIFVAAVGPIQVSGLTLGEARRIVRNQLLANRIGFDPGVEIVEFGSKSIAVSGLEGSELIPVTVRPTTLAEAVVATGGFGRNPEDTIVRVLRAGVIYEMSGEQILASSRIADRVLIDGDVVSVSLGYDPESALAYFDQQMRLREIERLRYDDLTARQERERARQERERTRQERERDAVRDAARFDMERARFDLEMENYRLEAARLRQEDALARLQARRETEQLNEDARIANVEARQRYLDRLRELEGLNREALRQARLDTNEIRAANRAERARERRERRELLELELQEERLRLERNASRRQQERDLFSERVRLGAVQQDYITVAGELKVQTVMPLPFDGQLTLNRVLYQDTGGIDLISGDTSEIYVIRTPAPDQVVEKLTAYHLDASSPAALAVASIFEMRPNDVVYVNPQPITKWNRVLTQILPSTGLLQSGLTTAVTGN